MPDTAINNTPEAPANAFSSIAPEYANLRPEIARYIHDLEEKIRNRKSKEQLALIAQANGAKSHGPTSEEGKRIASANSMKHGLTSNVLLTEEHREEFEELHAIWRDQLKPGSPAEERLVRTITLAEFRRDRSVLMQTCLMDYETDTRATAIWADCTSLDAAGLISVAFRNAHRESSAFELLLRYEIAYERSTARNIKLFIQLQDRRLKSEQGLESPTERDKNTIAKASLVRESLKREEAVAKTEPVPEPQPLPTPTPVEDPATPVQAATAEDQQPAPSLASSDFQTNPAPNTSKVIQITTATDGRRPPA
jgi:hypothetical protein